MKLFRVLLITTVVIATAGGVVEAGVSVTPDRHIVRLLPGESTTIEYQVRNSGAQDLDMEIDPKDWTGIMIDIDSWLSLKSSKLKIKTGETKPMEVTVTAPADVEGEMLAMLFLCYKEDKDSPLNIRNGIPLYLVIEGTEKYSARIETIKAEYTKGVKRSDLNIAVSIKNKGNIHIVPDIAVSVKDSKGEEIKKFLLKRPKTILRGEHYACQFLWRKPALPEGDYTIIVELNYEDKIKKLEKTAKFNIADGKLNMLEGKVKD